MQTLTGTCGTCHCPHVDITASPTGHNLKVERVTARVKAKDLASQMGVSGSRIAAIEREQYPSVETVRRYRQAIVLCQNVSHVEAVA